MTSVIVSSHVFRDLAGTRPTAEGSVLLRAALHARRMVLLKALLVRVEERRASLSAAARRRFEEDWALLEHAERTDPAAVREVVDYPITGAWLADVLGVPEGPGFEGRLAHLSGVAVAAAVRAGCPADRTLDVPPGRFMLPGLGSVDCPSGRLRLHGEDGRTRIADASGCVDVAFTRPQPGAHRPAGRGPGWSGLCELPGSPAVLDDLDPYRVPADGIGPERLPAAVRVRAAHRRWAERWPAARALLAATDPGRAEETAAILRAVVPLADQPRPGGVAMTATLRAAPGAMVCQLPADTRGLAESLVHEAHHTKLAVLHELVPLYRAAGTARHRVGWRPDPRPVPGVLQGAYAHLALTDLWARARSARVDDQRWRARAEHRFGFFRGQVGEALSILRESDELTFAGQEFVREMGSHQVRLGRAVRRSR
ncbi:HEXXH motif domain-containing protein [Streptomyces pluripotens]|uniref:HEXXH motif domain-containing protein n=1 Tax=Streptomyces pluripotens TaxID=1355015 RepID=A0A221P2Q9_9ACTN|nr:MULTISPECIES: HEXXH motif-containing putative peptide modification protein [Streptomyces]ARP72272.1 HEXXH motif domain-containing protein [Streptomyces pluripotens]ASN26521.1 HEXXH motif domain-containing protein [Streptomyces pluripotens]MCH0556156.1 hypothetical protein [Streptomyces sp. MUM 16J]